MHLAMAYAFFQGGTKPQADTWFTMVPVLVFFAVLYFLVMRPQMKEQKEKTKMVATLKKGDRIITTGGIWGEIDALEPQVIRLKLNDRTKITVSRSAVSGHQPSSSTPTTEK